MSQTPDPAHHEAERRALRQDQRKLIQEVLDRQHAATVAAIIMGVSAGVAVAAGVTLFILARSRSQALLSNEDPEAPLFV